jgi:peptide/nickel transport system permease protein
MAQRTEPAIPATGQRVGATPTSRLDRQSLSQQRATPGVYVRAWYRFRKDRVALTGLVVLILIIAFVLGAGIISHLTGFSYQKGNLRESLLPPFSPHHLLGTDVNGRDILTRLAYGGRSSLLVAGLASATTLAIGGIVGCVSGFFGGLTDSILMRIVDVLLCLPGLSLLILVSTLYQPGPTGLAIFLALVSWAGIARLVRGEVLAIRVRDYVDAARVLGASDGRIIGKHILPNVMPVMVVWVSLVIPGLILTEAALSFLGLGIRVPVPSWGNMLENAKDYYTKSWSNVFIPGFMIYITALAIYLVGSGLRDALDPRLNQ